MDLPPLRQMHAKDRTECVQTNAVLILSNDLLGNFCFVCQVEDALSGRHDSFGTSDVCTVQFDHSVQNGLKEIVDHKSFPDECSNHSNHPADELIRKCGTHSMHARLQWIDC